MTGTGRTNTDSDVPTVMGTAPLRHDLAVARRALRYRWLAGWVAPGAAVVDVHCGTGDGMQVLVDAGLHVTGVDRVAPLDLARRTHGPEADLVLGSAVALPLPDRSADVVACLDGLPAGEEKLALAELARVRCSGGHLVVTVSAACAFDLVDITGALDDLGLQTAAIAERATVLATLGPGTDAAVPTGGEATSFVVVAGDTVPTAATASGEIEAVPVDLTALLDRVDGELDALAAERSRAERRRDELHQLEVALLHAEQAAASVPDLVESHRITRDELVDAAVRTHAAEAATTAARDEIASLHELLADLRADLADARDAYANAMVRLGDIERSRSWRVTAPIRRVRSRAAADGSAPDA